MEELILSRAGPGFDFLVLWETGRAVLSGANPYTANGAMYPPAASFLFAILALLPLVPSFFLWIIANGVALLFLERRKALGWLLFVPALYMFVAGQLDLVLLALLPFLDRRRGWVAASLLTLKPQLAAIVLPWWIIHWLRTDRVWVLRFAGACLLLHAAPLLIRPQVYEEWLATVPFGAGHKFGGIGVWKLPVLFAAPLALGLLLFAFGKDEKASRAALTLASPVLGYHDAVALLGVAPWWFLGPLSLVALAASHAVGNVLPLISLPVAALAWRVVEDNGRSLTRILQGGR